MPFFMVDDQLQVNRKVHALIEVEGPDKGPQAIGLWTLAGSISQAKGSDGVVTTGDLVRLILDRSKALKMAALLVKHAFWHTTGHDCDKCPPVEAGSFLFHDWFAMGYDPGWKVIETRARRKELKSTDITDAVWARDKSMCRYCGRKVTRGDKKSAYRPSLDHVIPGLARGVTNLVVACMPCNQKKGQRTPEQAGMTLLPPPVDDDESDRSGKPGAIWPDIQKDTDPAIPHRAGHGLGPGLDPGIETGQWKGPAGEAPDVGTPGRFGSPWANWSGRPPSDPDESICPTHHLDLPCRKCAQDAHTELDSPSTPEGHSVG